MGLRFHADALTGVRQVDAKRVKDKVEWLWEHRAAIDHHSLKGKLSGFYKRRLGKYRIINTFDPNVDDLVIRRVGMRDDIYRIPL